MRFLKNSIARIVSGKIEELELKISGLENNNAKLRSDLNKLIEASCDLSEITAKLAISNSESQNNIATLAEYFCNMSDAMISAQSDQSPEDDWGTPKDKKQYLN